MVHKLSHNSFVRDQGCHCSSWPTLSSVPQYGAILTPAPFLPLSEEVLPVGIIAGATIGAGILLIFFFIALVFFLYRRRKGSEYGPVQPQHTHPHCPFQTHGRQCL